MTFSAAIEDAAIESMALSFDQTVVAGYRSHRDAERAVHLLCKDGPPVNTISIVGRNFEARAEVQGFYQPAMAALEGAKADAWSGGLFGLLVGTGMFVLPVTGPVLVLGPLAGLVAGAVSGAGTGALVTGLVWLGIPQAQAVRYEERIQTGESLVVVYGTTTVEMERACSVLRATRQAYVQTHCIFRGGPIGHTRVS